MTDTIVRNSTPGVLITNLLGVTGNDGAHEIETVLNAQMNGSGYNITYRPARLRSGTLTLLFATPAHAWAAVALLKTPYSFTLTADIPQLGMTFVLRPGRLQPALADEGIDAWTVEVPFQEVSP